MGVTWTLYRDRSSYGYKPTRYSVLVVLAPHTEYISRTNPHSHSYSYSQSHYPQLHNFRFVYQPTRAVHLHSLCLSYPPVIELCPCSKRPDPRRDLLWFAAPLPISCLSSPLPTSPSPSQSSPRVHSRPISNQPDGLYRGFSAPPW